MTPETTFLKDGTEVVLIHYFVTDFGQQIIACMPGLREFSATKDRRVPHMRTTEVSGVTCEQCKKTDAYKREGGYKKGGGK